MITMVINHLRYVMGWSSKHKLAPLLQRIPGTDRRTHSLTQAGQITLMNDQADVR